MATSGTYTYVPAQDDYLTEALARVGVRSDMINADHVNEATRSANLGLAAWSNRGFKQFQMQLSTVTVTAGQSQILSTGVAGTSFPVGTLQIFSSIIQVPGGGTTPYFDVPMVRIGRYDYEQIPYLGQTGRPDRFFWDSSFQLGSRVANLWPVPNQTYNIRAWCIVRNQDVGGLAYNSDITYEWWDAFAAMIAERLAEKYAPSMLQDKTARAEAAYSLAAQGERERGALRLRVDTRTRYSSR
jgi:hypothetical protein